MSTLAETLIQNNDALKAQVAELEAKLAESQNAAEQGALALKTVARLEEEADKMSKENKDNKEKMDKMDKDKEDGKEKAEMDDKEKADMEETLAAMEASLIEAHGRIEKFEDTAEGTLEEALETMVNAEEVLESVTEDLIRTKAAEPLLNALEETDVDLEYVAANLSVLASMQETLGEQTPSEFLEEVTATVAKAEAAQADVDQKSLMEEYSVSESEMAELMEGRDLEGVKVILEAASRVFKKRDNVINEDLTSDLLLDTMQEPATKLNESDDSVIDDIM